MHSLCGWQQWVPGGRLLVALAQLLVLASLCFLVYHGVENSTTVSDVPGRAIQPCLPNPKGKISPNQDAKYILPLWSCVVLVLGPSEPRASSTVSEDQKKGRCYGHRGGSACHCYLTKSRVSSAVWEWPGGPRWREQTACTRDLAIWRV